MIFLDKLKTIFEGKFGDILSNNKFSLFHFSKNVNEPLEVKNENTLKIDLTKLNEEEKELFKKEIRNITIQKEGDAFLINKTIRKTQKIKKNLPKDADELLLKFYRNKISPEMYKALEASLIVRNAFINNEDITELKKDIRNKYPTFGNNLCNLTTRNYFDDHFKELYLKMLEEEDFNIRVYQKKIEYIVKSLPYIAFIAKDKTYDELSGEVMFKLAKLKMYGTGKLILHGLGKGNVETTLKILEEYRNDKDTCIDIEINPKRTIITATLMF
ncbi:hypothetical protein KAJ87_01575 [Candidatus Pacearchaeota archaeon]|nr:hypothetical protein [Candidatus Pacearchaeota archaeon]